MALVVTSVSGMLPRAGLALSAIGAAALVGASLLIDAHPGAAALHQAIILSCLAGIASVLLGGVLLVGSAIRAVWRRRIVAALLSAAIGLAMVGVGGFAAYVAAIGSDLLTHPTANTDCRTPMSRFGWTYEAINYDVADDSLLGNSNPDPEHCSTQGQAAGTDVVTSDGVGIAGWYIPAADGAGPAAPTVVLVHGWGANKSEVLKYAVPLHEHYNVVAFDLRGGGRSGNAATTFGLREQQDLEAVIDWLERAKHPTHVAVMGNSMGGGTAAIAAASDLRIEALILDSTHAYVANIVERRLEVDSGYPAHPGTSAIVAGVWVRTGLDLMTADPVRAITSLGDRPLLLLHGAADIHDVPAQSVDVMYAAAESAGVSVERHFCPDASHGKVIDTCPAQWGEWATAFLDRVLR